MILDKSFKDDCSPLKPFRISNIEAGIKKEEKKGCC